MELNDFVDGLVNHIESHFSEAEELVLSEEDKTRVLALIDSKYKTYDWNYGYSPRYTFSVNYDNKHIASLKIEKGVIVNVDVLESTTFDGALNSLKDCRHEYSALSKTVDKDTSKELLKHLI